jgi:hypothetical protein
MPETEILQEQLKSYASDGALSIGELAAAISGVEFSQRNITETRRRDMIEAIVSSEVSVDSKIADLRHVIGSEFQVLP